ncbi:hypothetical protein TIFTF001_020720 [Ficus carica]|uniref:Uncharacterized protein n=1 Tax=Ficus carica TaxID=3494 RepID=A0AA88ABA8_FICCA|nr:hypothetical protein TIFTF001_020720 [Ficus carica]
MESAVPLPNIFVMAPLPARPPPFYLPRARTPSAISLPLRFLNFVVASTPLLTLPLPKSPNTIVASNLHHHRCHILGGISRFTSSITTVVLVAFTRIEIVFYQTTLTTPVFSFQLFGSFSIAMAVQRSRFVLVAVGARSPATPWCFLQPPRALLLVFKSV